MRRSLSLLIAGLCASAAAAVEGSHVRLTLHGISPDYDLDFSGVYQDPDGSWDYGFRLGLDLLATFDNFGGVDMAMGAGFILNYSEQTGQAIQGPVPNLELDTRLLGGGARYYAGLIGGSPSFSYELLPYVGIMFQELRLEVEGPTFREEAADVDWVWDTGVMFNATTRFGEHWVLGLSAGVFYRYGDFDYTLGVDDVAVSYQQFGFEYGLIGGLRF